MLTGESLNGWSVPCTERKHDAIKIDDPAFDAIEPNARNRLLLAALKRQIVYARKSVSFWDDLYGSEKADVDVLENLFELSSQPILTKEEFRQIPPLDLVPKQRSAKLYLNRWISGTSGPPTVSCWTYTDWNAAVASVVRTLRRHTPVSHPMAFNTFSQGHVLVEVVDAFGRHVGNGKSGRIVVTHLAGVDSQGNACEHQGTQIIRLATGDRATYFSEECTCGLTTPRLKGIGRLE